MLTHYGKHGKQIFNIHVIILLLTGLLGVPPGTVQAGQVVAALIPEGAKPLLPE